MCVFVCDIPLKKYIKLYIYIYIYMCVCVLVCVLCVCVCVCVCVRARLISTSTEKERDMKKNKRFPNLKDPKSKDNPTKETDKMQCRFERTQRKLATSNSGCTHFGIMYI